MSTLIEKVGDSSRIVGNTTPFPQMDLANYQRRKGIPDAVDVGLLEDHLRVAYELATGAFDLAQVKFPLEPLEEIAFRMGVMELLHNLVLGELKRHYYKKSGEALDGEGLSEEKQMALEQAVQFFKLVPGFLPDILLGSTNEGAKQSFYAELV